MKREYNKNKRSTKWKTLNEDEQKFIKMVLAFFAASDGVVLENLAIRFMGDVQLSEARAFYGFQVAMENIHSEMYSLLIDTYIQDSNEKQTLFEATQNFPCITKKAEWAKKWLNDNRSSFAARLVAFAAIEGIFFSAKSLSMMSNLSPVENHGFYIRWLLRTRCARIE